MNGTISSISLKDSLEIEKKLQKKINIRFISAILISNFAVYLLSFTSSTQTDPKKIVSHSGFTPVIINAKTNVQALDTDSTKITIVDKLGKIVLTEAYLVAEIKDGLSSEEKKFKIEINTQELTKLSVFQNKELLLLPYFELKKTDSKKQVKNYEINF